MENKEIPTNHDFDFNQICHYFLQFERQGPGSPEMTLRALSFMDEFAQQSHIADLGAGTGGQTMTLASATRARITALDLFPAFIDRLKEQARECGVQDRVQGMVGSMDALLFEKNSLDAIWCEGAIYHIGFERGLRLWRDYLKPGGYVAVTENTWFTEQRPTEIEDFWKAAYPEIDTIPRKIEVMQRVGYEFVAAFALPESLWADFYAPQAEALKTFVRQGGDPAFIASQRREKQLWEHYKVFYGLAFYIGRRRE